MRLEVLSVLVALARAQESPSLLLALMVRDEEDNLRANLPQWAPIGDAVVCGIDERTTDQSARAVVESLPSLPRWIFSFRFENFGQGRSVVLREAWRKFSNVSHVLTLDPDWQPQILAKSELDWMHRNYLFLVWDRNGLTTRTLNWLVRHEPGLKFERRLHEQLVQPGELGPVKRVSWKVLEREVSGRRSWHTTDANGHSQSYERYLKDIKLLEADLVDLGPNDRQTLYYLGATHLSALEAMVGIGEHQRTPQTEYHVSCGIRYLERRLSIRELDIDLSQQPRTRINEQTWAAMRWLAHAYHYYARNVTEAEAWYQRCRTYDSVRVDCVAFLAALYRQLGRHNEAWRTLLPALQATYSEGARAFAYNFYIYSCTLPLEAALSLLALLSHHRLLRNSNWHVMLHFGNELLAKATAACTDPTRRFISAQPVEVEGAATAYATLMAAYAQAAWTECIPGPTVDLAAANDPEMTRMMRAWGLRVCV